MSDSDLLTAYSEVADAVINQYFNQIPLADSHRRLLRRACGLTLHRDVFSDYSTGLVFAGFGAKELSPTLVAYQIDGVIGGRLKKRLSDKVSTNRREVTGEILPFAQREMVDRFLYGIDPGLELGIEDFMRAQIELAATNILESLPRGSKNARAMLERIISAANEAALDDWRHSVLPRAKADFVRDLKDMTFLMPKQEMAKLAEELVHLTSVKRKFSSGLESVGGPIDVAVISRTDGFVWVRRKHYFEPNLNPRYFHRKYGAAQR